MIQHMVQGAADDNIALLAGLYSVAAKDIGIATFGQWSTSVIYNWLKNNGGIPQRKDSSVATGYHWSFAPGMVVNIPKEGTSFSPVVDGAIPGGPSVVMPDVLVGIIDQNSPNPNQSDMATEGQSTVAAQEQGVPPPGSSSGGSFSLASVWADYGTMILVAGVGIGALMLMGDDKKGKRRKTTRKTTRRTTRRKTATRRRR